MGALEPCQFPPVSLLLEVEELPEAVKVDNVTGSNGALHHQVVQHCDDVHDDIAWGLLVTSTPRELLNEVAHHLGCCQGKGDTSEAMATAKLLQWRAPWPQGQVATQRGDHWPKACSRLWEGMPGEHRKGAWAGLTEWSEPIQL